MRKVIYAMLVSADGFIENPAGSLDWSVPDTELHQHFNDQERELGTILYGRRMYEIMSAFWPTADEDPQAPPVIREYARIWRAKPKIVFSQTLPEVGWHAQLFRGDLGAEIKRLKALPGGDMSVGGAALAASFLQLGLIDEVYQYVHPVILGGGKPMFTQLQEQIDLSLVETRQFGSGVVLLHYALRGAA
jgi:dihydrofolate reductase